MKIGFIVVGLLAVGLHVARADEETVVRESAPPPALAAVTTQLDQLTTEALEHSPEIVAAQAAWEAAKARAPQMSALADPMIGADVERSDSTKFADYNDIEYMVQQEVPWFGKRGLAGRAEAGMARQAEMQYRMKTLEVVSMVKRMYYDLWQVEGELRINRENQRLMTQFVDSATARYEVNRGSQADVLKARTELDKLAEDEVDINRMRENARADLNRFVGREPNTPIAMEAVDLVPAFSLNLDDLKTGTQEANPELRGVKEGMLAAARSRLDLAKKAYRPDLQLRVEARQFDGRSGIREYDTAIFMNFPWFNRRKNNAAIAEAKASVTAAEQDYEGMRLKTAAEVEKLYHGIRTMQHHYELYVGSILPQQRAAVAATRAAYEAGDMNFLDLLDAQRMLLAFEVQNLQNTAEAFRLAAELEVMTGGVGEKSP